jgi:hypothetical protein
MFDRLICDKNIFEFVDVGSGKLFIKGHREHVTPLG